MKQSTNHSVEHVVRAEVRPHFFAQFLGAAFALLAFLLTLRGFIVSDELADANPVNRLAILSLAFRQDLFFLSTLVMVGFLTSLRVPSLMNGRQHKRMILLSASFVLLTGIANVAAVSLLGESFTLGWLYYSDFFVSPDQIRSALLYAKITTVALLVSCFAAFLAICAIFGEILRRWITTTPRAAIACAPFFLLVILALMVGNAVDLPTGKRTNAIMAFAQSIANSPKLQGIPIEGSESDLNNLKSSNISISKTVQLVMPAGSRHQIQNVIYFVMESTGAQYVEGFGSRFNNTPYLKKYASQALRFTNAYAHVPATNFSLISMFGGVIPELSELSMTFAYPNLQLTTIASVANEVGMRTALFMSGDTRFQDAGKFLLNSGFDTVKDHRDWVCDKGFYPVQSDEWKFLDTANDLCTIDATLDWISNQPNVPFLAAVWTGMAHHPYNAGTYDKHYVQDETLNRYINSITMVDEAFGRLMQGLEERGLAESTLIVVVGDHGQAFGQHNQFLHATALYEENIRVPLMFVNSKLFSSESSPNLVGMSDIPPTILDLMQLELPELWQGRSAFSPPRPNMVNFFLPFKGFQVGFRADERKFILNSETGKVQYFNLSNDPNERSDLAKAPSSEIDWAKLTISRWVEQQNNATDQLLNSSLDPTKKIAAGAALTLKITASGTIYQNPPKAEIRIDGKTIGYLTVRSAVNNVNHVATTDEIENATRFYSFPIGNQCPRRVEITFLNDEWAGEGNKGDSNLYVREIQIGKIHIPPGEMRALEASSGANQGSYFELWSAGTITAELGSTTNCNAENSASD